MGAKRVPKGPSSGMGLTGSPCLPSSVEGVPQAVSCQALVDGAGPGGTHGPILCAVPLHLCMGCSSYREGALVKGSTDPEWQKSSGGWGGAMPGC